MAHSCSLWAVGLYCPLDLSFWLTVRRPDRCRPTDYLCKQTHRRNKNDYRPSLCNTATQAWPDKNEILTQCWFIVGAALQIMAHYWLDIGLTSRVCSRRGSKLSLFARLPLIKPYNCEGYLCSCLEKYGSIDIITWKHYNYISIGLMNLLALLSPVVLNYYKRAAYFQKIKV